MTCQTLLRKCGNLDEVYENFGPGKYIARVSLSFTSTRDSMDVRDFRALVYPSFQRD